MDIRKAFLVCAKVNYGQWEEATCVREADLWIDRLGLLYRYNVSTKHPQWLIFIDLLLVGCFFGWG